jgi:predicted phosphodiesterase
MADVHGNLPALEAVLEDMRQYEPDGIIVAGDFVGGPYLAETVRLLRSLDSWMIRGNGDNGLVERATVIYPRSIWRYLRSASRFWFVGTRIFRGVWSAMIGWPSIPAL